MDVNTQLHVDILWDSEASVWVATSDDVTGLVAEAESQEEMQKELEILIPILIEANQVDSKLGITPINLHYLKKDTFNINL